MKYALIGCGRISPNHITAAMNNNLDIVGLCDLEINKANQHIIDYELSESTKSYVDYKLMIENENPELIAIATESGNHAEIAKYCIKKGIHLIIEKPIALSLIDADEIIALSKEYSIVVSACHQNRFNKSIQKIRESIEHNRFGKLFHGTAHIRWNRGQDYYTQAPWRGTWAQDGGALMNQCIHNIDLLRWMMGNEIDEVFAYTDNLNHELIETEDLGIAIVKFKNRSYGIIEGTTNVYPKNLEETLYIFGEKGTVKAGGKSVNIIEEWLFDDKLDNSEEVKLKYNENPLTVYGFGHTPLYNDVIDSINKKRQPYVTAEDGRRALELVLAIYESSKRKQPVRFPISCDSSTLSNTIDFLGKNK
jgi:predicted dehydrogenase